MSDILAIDFANEVERNRQSLITHCLSNGVSVSNASSLSTIVEKNNTINVSTQDRFKVEFIDLDGSYAAPTQYVEYGQSVTLPSENPSYDSDYLEFVEWATSFATPLDNVKRDTLVMPFYRTKLDTNLNQRPTYLICQFNSDYLSPTIQIGNIHTNAYILWGDGTSAQQITSTTVSHTYSSAGQYVITIYGDSYSLGGTSFAGLFTTIYYRYALQKAYLGENIILNDYLFYCNYMLTKVVLPVHITRLNSYTFSNCINVDNIVVPKNVTTIGYSNGNCFDYCYDLKHIIFTKAPTTNYINCFRYCRSLETVLTSSPSTYMYDTCYNLKNIYNNTLNGYAYQHCRQLTNFEISSTVTSIPECCFADSGLTKINIPEGVLTIADYAFDYCYSLNTMHLPSSLITISANAFRGCSSLKNVSLGLNFNCTVYFTGLIFSNNSYINIANNLKDRTGLTELVIRLGADAQKAMENIYLDENGNETTSDATGAVNLVTLIRNKNWNLQFTDSN